jgi:hypothetical protein
MEYNIDTKTLKGTPEEIGAFLKMKNKQEKTPKIAKVKKTTVSGKRRKRRFDWTGAMGESLKDIVKRENPHTTEEKDALALKLLNKLKDTGTSPSNANLRRLKNRIKVYTWMISKNLL